MNVDNLYAYTGLKTLEGEREMACQDLERILCDTFFQIITAARQYLHVERDKGLVWIAIADIEVVQFDSPALNICTVPLPGCYQNSMNFLENISPYRLICDIIGIFQNAVRHDNHQKSAGLKNVPTISSSLLV